MTDQQTDPTLEKSDDLARRIEGFVAHLPGELEHDDDETLLETVAEALAASYGSTTFATAGALIAELELRGVTVRRTSRIPARTVAGDLVRSVPC